MERLLTLIMLSIISIKSLAAEPIIFKQWMVGKSENPDIYYAATFNPSGSILGRYCSISTKNCIWLFMTEISCDNGAKIPALISTLSGAASITLTCGSHFADGKNEVYKLLIDTSEFQIEDFVSQNKGVIGLALSLKNGEFKADRFSMEGSKDALTFESEIIHQVNQTNLNSNTF